MFLAKLNISFRKIGSFKFNDSFLLKQVIDINDSAPRFLYDYRPVIMEKSPPQKVQEILATDDDDRSKGNGPPFSFQYVLGLETSKKKF